MEKIVISKAEFTKRVEIEYCFLVREYVKPDEARNKAHYTVSQKYMVE